MWPNLDGAGLVGAPAPWVVSDPAHWFYRGTQLAKGSQIAGLIGGEADRRLSGYPRPSGEPWNVLASSPFTTRSGGTGLHEATTYKATSGAWVFNAGTLNYAKGVGGAGTSDTRVQTMTTNLLTRQTGAALTVTTARAGGPTRYETAVAASAHTFAANFGGTVHLATGLDFPDALGASAATRGEGPVLLVPRSSLPTAVRDELIRLKPTKVVIVGGSDVVTDAVADAVQSAIGVTPQRAEGPDRYATGAKVSEATFAPGVAVAYVATGRDFPDALAAGAAGAQLGGPVLLTQPTGLPAVTAAELRRLNPQRIVVAGGPSVVSTSVEAALAQIAPTTRRSGSDRYGTAIAIARDARGALGRGSMLLATGANFPDALAAGPVAAATGGSLMLVPMGSLPVTVAEEIVRNDPDELLAVGDSGVVSDSTLNAAAALFDSVNGVSALSSQRSAPGLVPAPALPEPTGKPLPPELEHAPDTTLPWLAP
jgi:putative cell wall-binding protein